MYINNCSEIYIQHGSRKAPAILCNLPLPFLRKIIALLDFKDVRSLARTNRKFYALALFDPSEASEKMCHRAVMKVGIKIFCTAYKGPTEKFLNMVPKSAGMENIQSTVQIWMRRDPMVNLAIREICENEVLYPKHCPLYHAMQLETFCLTFVTRQLLTSAMGDLDSLPTDAPLMRFPKPEGFRTTTELLESVPMNERYDHIPEVQKELLATNPFIFTNIYTEGESTWVFFTENKSVRPPDHEKFFNMLCDEYGLLPDKKDREPFYDKFALVVSELPCLAGRYARLLRPVEKRDETGNLGVLLQILVPQEIVGQICYLSGAYGIPLKTSESPQEAFMRIREKPEDHREMQVRILAQSLLVPDYQIKVFLHGYADFFSVTPETLKVPSGMSEKDKQRLMQIVEEKKKYFQAIQDLLYLAMVKTHRNAPPLKKATGSRSRED